jgi:hypothetical protein
VDAGGRFALDQEDERGFFRFNRGDDLFCRNRAPGRGRLDLLDDAAKPGGLGREKRE